MNTGLVHGMILVFHRNKTVRTSGVWSTRSAEYIHQPDMVGNPVPSRLNRKIHFSLSPRARVNAAREDVVLRDGLGRPILHCSTSNFEFSNTSEAVSYEDFFQ